MMKIRVRCFASIREIVGAYELVVDLPEGSTLNQLLRDLCERFPRLQALGGSLLFSVNREYAAIDTTLTEEDDVALIPPVSGGADV